MIELTDETPNAVIETQIIDPLTTIRNVSNLYKRIPKGQFGVLENGQTVQLFKDLANKKGKNGLYSALSPVDLEIRAYESLSVHFFPVLPLLLHLWRLSNMNW